MACSVASMRGLLCGSPVDKDTGKQLGRRGQRQPWTHTAAPAALGDSAQSFSRCEQQGKCIIFSLKIHFGTDSLQRCN